MGFIRNLAETIRADLEYRLKVPLRKDGAVALGSPKAPTEYGITDSTKNTAIPVEFGRRAFLVFYDRVDFSTYITPSLTLAGGLRLSVSSVKTTKDLVTDLNRTLALDLRTGDLVDEPLVITAATTSVTITASSECLWFTGTVVIPLKGSYEQQGDTLVQVVPFDARVFRNVTDPTTTGYLNGGLLTYGLSYVSQTAALAAIPATTTMYSWESITTANATALATALKAVDGLNWNYNAASGVEYNLANGCVVYNGPVAGWTPRLHSNFDNIQPSEFWDNQLPRNDHSHVLVFCPNPNSGANNLLYAPLFIHYGTVVDPAAAPEFKPPVHWWPLTDGDLTNHGSAGSPVWAIPLNFTINSNGTWAALQSQNIYALGATLDCTKDFTLSIKLFRNDALVPNDSGAYEGLFSNSTATGDGSLLSNGGWCHLAGATNKWNDPAISTIKAKEPIRLTITKKASEAFYLIYFDDQLVCEHTIPNTYPMAFTHFGKAGTFFLKTSTQFCDIRFYDYCMTAAQVKLMNG